MLGLRSAALGLFREYFGGSCILLYLYSSRSAISQRLETVFLVSGTYGAQKIGLHITNEWEPNEDLNGYMVHDSSPAKILYSDRSFKLQALCIFNAYHGYLLNSRGCKCGITIMIFHSSTRDSSHVLYS